MRSVAAPGAHPPATRLFSRKCRPAARTLLLPITAFIFILKTHVLMALQLDRLTPDNAWESHCPQPA